MSVIAARLRSSKHSFRAFHFSSTCSAFDINGLQISPTLQLIKPAAQASCNLYFSHSFTKSAGLILSCLLVKPKSTYFSLNNSSIGRGHSKSSRTHSIFLDRRWFYILILNISQSSRLMSFRIEAQAVNLSLILAGLRVVGGL